MAQRLGTVAPNRLKANGRSLQRRGGLLESNRERPGGRRMFFYGLRSLSLLAL